MYKGKSILSLIPARGGSKGLPRKNIKPLLGKPLITWTIEEALASKYLDRVIVSTDDAEIAEISQKYGAEVPFIRPEELSTDEAKTMDVVIHALRFFRENEYSPDVVVLLQPTSPLRTHLDIDNSLELFFKGECRTLVSVYEASNSLFRSFEIKDGYLKPFLGETFLNKSRQELPKLFIPNGAIYIAYRDSLERDMSFYTKDTYPYIMPVERSIDIDTELDFIIAETILKTKGQDKLIL